MMRQFYNEGFARYASREWPRAQFCFRRCLRYLPYDGPTKYLLKTMASYTDVQHWLGYRPFPGNADRYDSESEQGSQDYSEDSGDSA
jgi:hypothetical protein